MFKNNLKEAISDICQIHNKPYAYLQNSLSQTENILACSSCQFYNSQKGHISIQEIQNNINSKKPIFNWPRGLKQEDYEFLVYLSEKKQNLGLQIEQCYDQLQEEITQNIQQSKKQSLKQLNEYFPDVSGLIDIYQHSFKVNQLKKIVYNNSQNMQSMRQEYQSLLSQLHPKLDYDLEYLEKNILIYKNIEKNISCFEQIQIQIRQILEQINLFPNKLSVYPIRRQIIYSFNQKNLQDQEIQQTLTSINNSSQLKNRTNKPVSIPHQQDLQQNIQLMQSLKNSTFNFQREDRNFNEVNNKPIGLYPNIINVDNLDKIIPINAKHLIFQCITNQNLQRFRLKFEDANISQKINESKRIHQQQDIDFNHFQNELNLMFQQTFEKMKNQGEQYLAKKIVLYFNKYLHNNINQILLSKNQKLIESWIFLIQFYQKSLLLYNQLESYQHYIPKTLYKPCKIPTEHYQNLIQKSNNICFTSFQTFTSDETIAVLFFLYENSKDQNVNVIFAYQPHKDLKNEIKPAQVDQEFITQPLMIYTISDIQQKINNNIMYYEVYIELQN